MAWMRGVWLMLLLGMAMQNAVAQDKLLVFGDSLSAGYGIAVDKAWPQLLQRRLKDNGFSHIVVNASTSGETTAGGVTRLPGLLTEHKPKWVILELGANDGLRGLPVVMMRNNLAAMIEMCRKKGARVLLVGMRLPPNYGPAYTEIFETSFGELAREHKTALVPFLFEGLSSGADWFLSDGVHPNAAAQPMLLENVWRGLKPLLAR